jgi:hypothetical protein
MNTSLQAAGRLSPDYANPIFPWRCVFLMQHSDGLWTVATVFEMRTEAECHEQANELLESYGPEVASGELQDVHYYVGEVAL